MALKPCRECSRPVAEDAATCPECGAAAPGRTKSLEWQPCPHCGSASTNRMGPGVMGLSLFVGGSCMMWIPIIGWVIAPILFIMALIVWVGALIPSGKVAFHCQGCRKWFRVAKNDIRAGA